VRNNTFAAYQGRSLKPQCTSIVHSAWPALDIQPRNGARIRRMSDDDDDIDDNDGGCR
jgi:hypothetical protein